MTTWVDTQLTEGYLAWSSVKAISFRGQIKTVSTLLCLTILIGPLGPTGFSSNSFWPILTGRQSSNASKFFRHFVDQVWTTRFEAWILKLKMSFAGWFIESPNHLLQPSIWITWALWLVRLFLRLLSFNLNAFQVETRTSDSSQDAEDYNRSRFTRRLKTFKRLLALSKGLDSRRMTLTNDRGRDRAHLIGNC